MLGWNPVEIALGRGVLNLLFTNNVRADIRNFVATDTRDKQFAVFGSQSWRIPKRPAVSGDFNAAAIQIFQAEQGTLGLMEQR